ncbi:adaptor protein [Lactobacillus selangorensis]|uniref:Adaptor protein n=1 Tax=Lactobacillus selangorensis TaxID=81857 RepID=A0A0R2FU52_9LACO|nr:adaptor protein [Lactobacillus selangorensis]KRN31939.1 adaptor protein [Lactobacillus selangorensis]
MILGNEDLAERGITVLDLLGNSSEIESFFYSILEEVDKDHMFKSSDAVTFQVMPSQSGLELLISKNLPGAAKNSDSDSAADDSQDADQSHPDGDAISEALRKRLLQTDDPATEENAADYENYLQDPDTPTREVVLKLADFEDVIALAKILRPAGAISDLYRYQNAFYLHLIFFVDETPKNVISDDLAVAYEYAQKTKVTPDVLAEHGQILMEKTALELTRYYFK